jgi:hypothetical protein
LFGSVFIKKNNQTEILKKNNRTETGSNRPVLVRFFRKKTGSNQFGSVFSGFAQFFSNVAFFFGLDLVWFFQF